MQPDAAPNTQDAPDAEPNPQNTPDVAPHPQNGTWYRTTSSGYKAFSTHLLEISELEGSPFTFSWPVSQYISCCQCIKFTTTSVLLFQYYTGRIMILISNLCPPKNLTPTWDPITSWIEIAEGWILYNCKAGIEPNNLPQSDPESECWAWRNQLSSSGITSTLAYSVLSLDE